MLVWVRVWGRERKSVQVRVFVEVDSFESELAQTLSAVLVRCGVGGDTSAAEARADSAFVCHD